jgi:hypothetical protein
LTQLELVHALQPHFPDFAALLKSRGSEPYFLEHVRPPLSVNELEMQEKQLGIGLPPSFKRFATSCGGLWLDGGRLQMDARHLFFHEFRSFESLSPQQKQVVKAKGGIWPPPSNGMLCFAEYWLEADGDQALFDVKNPESDGELHVHYYAHEGRPPTADRIATSFHDWLEGLSVQFAGADAE